MGDLDRRAALAKAALTTADVTAGLLNPEQSRTFVVTIKDASTFGQAIQQQQKVSPTGKVDKLTTARRIIRAAPENADDGYRAGATFGSVPYTAKKIRLPWEVDEDVFHENIEGEQFEQTLVNDMAKQFGLDLDDLDINGDTAAVGTDAAFLNIDDGILKQISAAAGTYPGRNINGATTNGGVLAKEHFFSALFAMPPKYRQRGGLRWIASPNTIAGWWESVTNRMTPGGDAALLGGSEVLNKPLGIPFLEVAQWPDNLIVLADPQNFIRIVTWDIRRRRITGETDATLAALDKRFFIYFMKRTIIIQELDAVVRLYGLVPPV